MTRIFAPPLPTRADADCYLVPTYTPQDKLIERGEVVSRKLWKFVCGVYAPLDFGLRAAAM